MVVFLEYMVGRLSNNATTKSLPPPSPPPPPPPTTTTTYVPGAAVSRAKWRVGYVGTGIPYLADHMAQNVVHHAHVLRPVNLFVHPAA